jgi:hypothetical protein
MARNQHPAHSSACSISLALILELAIAICCISVPALCSSEANNSASVPVLLELFTSEGCSSCPPADAFIQRMDSSQPLPGAHLIVLSEHVDYWDHDGWKDPFSSHAFTERQNDYVRALHLNSPSTPQIILDGTSILRGDPQHIQQMLTQATSDSKVSIRLSAVAFESGPTPALRMHIDIPATALKHAAEILVASALDRAESDVLRGENSGKHLQYVAVAEQITKVGTLKKGKDFSQDVQLKLKPAAEPRNLRIIAFVQESGPGKVIGVAEQRMKE